MRILVTGATGFIGRHLVPFLQTKGHIVRCAVRETVSWINAEQIIVSTLDSYIDWTEALQQIDCVIHLSARVHIMETETGLTNDKFIQINSNATKNFAEQAASCGVKRFVFLSTIKVNGELTTETSPFSEDNIPKPEDRYAKSKLLAEQYLEEVGKATAMETVVLRPPLVYGPGVKANFLRLIQSVNKGWPMPFARINNRRSFIYIDNLVNAIEAVLQAPLSCGACFLVSDDESWSLADLIKQISLNLGHKPRLFPIPVKSLKFLLTLVGKQDAAARLLGSLLVNNAKIKQITGWRPQVSSQEGIAKTVQWYQQETKKNTLS